VTAQVNGGILTITPVNFGEATVLVEMMGDENNTHFTSEYGLLRVLVTTGTKVAAPQIAAGDGFTISLKADGTVWAWGDNSFGQLGLGDTVGRLAPTQVLGGYRCTECGRTTSQGAQDDPCTLTTGCNGLLTGEYLTDIVAISAGTNFAMALDKNGVVYTWGGNDRGQLGNQDMGGIRSLPDRVATGLVCDVCATPSETGVAGGACGESFTYTGFFLTFRKKLETAFFG
jgi:alpha-tubulin suppressor-like RCC1 family protein